MWTRRAAVFAGKTGGCNSRCRLCLVVQQQEDGVEQMQETVFRLAGRFDGAAALRLRQEVMIDESPLTIIDFSHVDNFDDSTLALLTVTLALLLRKGRSIALRDLREHQVRVLQHFGVEIGIDGAVHLGLRDELPFSA